jgi:hypothetical protein
MLYNIYGYLWVSQCDGKLEFEQKECCMHHKCCISAMSHATLQCQMGSLRLKSIRRIGKSSCLRKPFALTKSHRTLTVTLFEFRPRFNHWSNNARCHNACCPCSRAHCRDLGRVLKQESGVDAGAVPADAEEQVRPRGSARRADQADSVAFVDLFTRLHIDL